MDFCIEVHVLTKPLYGFKKIEGILLTHFLYYLLSNEYSIGVFFRPFSLRSFFASLRSKRNVSKNYYNYIIASDNQT